MNIIRRLCRHRRKPQVTYNLLRLSAALCSGALAFPALAAAPQAAGNQEYTVRLAYKTGEINRYRWIIEAKINDPQDGKEKPLFFRMIVKETTKEVKPDGAAVLESDFEETYIKLGDVERDASAEIAGRITQTRDPLGRVLEGKVEGGNSLVAGASGGETMFSQTAMAFYPPRPVKMGETWKIEIEPKNPKFQHYKMTGTGTLLGTETVDNVKTLKIKAVTDTAGDAKSGLKLHFEGVGNIDPTSGKLLRINGASEGFAGLPGSNQIRQELLKGDSKSGADKKADANKPQK